MPGWKESHNLVQGIQISVSLDASSTETDKPRAFAHTNTCVYSVFELVGVRDGLSSLSDVHFMRSDVRGVITFLCTY